MPSRREPIWTGNFIAVSFVNLFVFLSFQMIFPTLPLYVKSLGGSDAVIGLVMGIFTAATLIARPTAGILLDRIGKKKVLLCGLGVFTVMVYLYGMVGNIALIISGSPRPWPGLGARRYCDGHHCRRNHT